MNSDSLPLAHRSVAIVVFFAVGWLVVGSERLLELGGDGIVPVGVGLVAASVLLGAQLPLGLWPARLHRKRFDWRPGAIWAGAVGGLVVLTARSELAELWLGWNRGATIGMVLGGAAVAAGLGMTRLRPQFVWFGLALGLALIPGIGGTILSTGVDFPAAVRALGFFAVAEIGRVYVTEELGFRRLMLRRDSSLVEVLAVGVAYALWVSLFVNWTISPWEMVLFAAVPAGLGAGVLYVLSGSLMVSALYVGMWSAIPLSVNAAAASGMVDDRFWFVSAISTLAGVAVLAAHALRRGKLVLLPRRASACPVADVDEVPEVEEDDATSD